MENNFKFKFKLGDIVIVDCRHMPKCRIIERFYEYNDRLYFGGGVGVPIENRCYKVEPVEGYDPQELMLPGKIAEDRLFGTEKEAANQRLRKLANVRKGVRVWKR